MARAVGIPARLAAGYSSGEYDSSSGSIGSASTTPIAGPKSTSQNTAGGVRTDRRGPACRQAHGAARAGAFNQGERTNPQDRPGPEANIPEGEELGRVAAVQSGRDRWSRGAPPVDCAAHAGDGRRGRSNQRMASLAARISGAESCCGLYERMMRLGRLIGVVGAPSQTPYEYADTLGDAIPRGQADIHEITDVFVRERFSGRTPAEEEGSRLADAWLRLRQDLPTEPRRARPGPCDRSACIQEMSALTRRERCVRRPR